MMKFKRFDRSSANPGLIVMGTHARRGAERGLMAHNREELLRPIGPVPLVTINATVDEQFAGAPR